jgi:hypothetical protein
VKAGTHKKNTEKRTFFWITDAATEPIQDWEEYLDLVIHDTKAIFQEKKIEKDIEKIYSIYHDEKEIPVNRLSGEDSMRLELVEKRKNRYVLMEMQADAKGKSKKGLGNFT